MRFSLDQRGKRERPPRAPSEIRSCFCVGPQPGHELCPCMERNESNRDRLLRELQADNDDLRRRLKLQMDREGATLAPAKGAFGRKETARERQARGGIGP